MLCYIICKYIFKTKICYLWKNHIIFSILKFYTKNENYFKAIIFIKFYCEYYM
jgi:hypothetical protein